MNIETIESVYFVGAGGIGMSALVRYFLSKGKTVAGYDRTATPLTEELIAEGAQIHYEENVDLIPQACRNKKSTLVVLTPAVPEDHAELTYFRSNGFEIQKRAQVLGTITHSSKALCVAGTHGKTTTSSMAAHLLHQSHVRCTAFLGGISKNYGTNLLLSQESPYTVIEADEFDRSFHWLSPYMSVVTSTDPDHLDIYGTAEAYLKSFEHYTSLIQPGGALIVRKGISLQPKVNEGVRVYTYSRDEGDFHAENIRIGNGEIFIDFVAPIPYQRHSIGSARKHQYRERGSCYGIGSPERSHRRRDQTGNGQFPRGRPQVRFQDKERPACIPQRLRSSSFGNKTKCALDPRAV